MSQRTISVGQKQRTINGRNIQGEERIYTFNLMPSKTAYRVFHEFCNKEVQLAAPVLIEHLSQMWNPEPVEPKEGEEPRPPEPPPEFDPDNLPTYALEITKYFPMVLTWDRIIELNGLMLSGATVTTDGEVTSFDKDGFADIDPVEAYNALLYAIVANYEPQIPPLLLALSVQGEDDTDQNPETTAGQK